MTGLTGKIMVLSLGLLIFSCLLTGQAVELNQLVEKGLYEEAEEFCSGKRGEEQRLCFERLGEICAEKKDYVRAVYYYQRAGNEEKLDSSALLLEEQEFFSGLETREMEEARMIKMEIREQHEAFYKTYIEPVLRPLPSEMDVRQTEPLTTIDSGLRISEGVVLKPMEPVTPDTGKERITIAGEEITPISPVGLKLLMLTIRDYGYGSDPAHQFKEQNLVSGVHIININRARSYTVIYDPNPPAMPNQRYLRITSEGGN
ncbi:MAG: hypothetical protein GY940_24885, partial [bacterium]|nr:hypothetical protein [bacterium]